MDKNSYLIDFKEFIMKNQDLSPKEIQMVRDVFDKLKIDTDENTILMFENIESNTFGYFLVSLFRTVGCTTDISSF